MKSFKIKSEVILTSHDEDITPINAHAIVQEAFYEYTQYSGGYCQVIWVEAEPSEQHHPDAVADYEEEDDSSL